MNISKTCIASKYLTLSKESSVQRFREKCLDPSEKYKQSGFYLVFFSKKSKEIYNSLISPIQQFIFCYKFFFF